MKEIKFRAWDKQWEKWVYSDIVGLDLFFANVTKGNLENVCEYTGLHDKKGKEIYEGDIIKLGDGTIGKVEYGKCSCTADDNYCGGDAIGFNVNKEILGNGMPWSNNQTTSKNMKIISNIYENPELLRGGE